MMLHLLSKTGKLSRPLKTKIFSQSLFRNNIKNFKKLHVTQTKNSNGCDCGPSKGGKREEEPLCQKSLTAIFDLNCKNAVVVGGDGGIGHAAAQEILSNNAKVVGIFGRNVCKGMEVCHSLNCRFGKRRAVFFKVDVTSRTDIDCAICKLSDEFGMVDVFVNSFGICDGKNWETELNINLIGMARSTIAAHKHLSCTKNGGVIVNLSGIFGIIPSAGCPTTSAAQYGIIGLSQSFGKETLFKRTNVRVITLCPSLTDTKLFRNADKRALTPFMGKCFQEEMCTLIKQKPEVCGNAIVWLIRYGLSGTVWMINNNDLYKINPKVLDDCTELYYKFPSCY